jgi:hypothetical protein
VNGSLTNAAEVRPEIDRTRPPAVELIDPDQLLVVGAEKILVGCKADDYCVEQRLRQRFQVRPQESIEKRQPSIPRVIKIGLWNCEVRIDKLPD